jgi:hypothetical protein
VNLTQRLAKLRWDRAYITLDSSVERLLSFEPLQWMGIRMNEWTKQRDLLIEETLAFVQGVAAVAPKTSDSPEPDVPSPRPVGAEVLTPKGRLDMERAVVKKRIADFAAHQRKFQQEREEYYERTMKAARATQWTSTRDGAAIR